MTLSPEALRALRGRRIAMVYQDPLASLNPCLPWASQLSEVLTVHQGLGESRPRGPPVTRCSSVSSMPDPPAIMRRYPHQLSGGQQQRVVIAMALLANPTF